MTTITFTRSTSLSSFVKQFFFLGSSSTTNNGKLNDTMNSSDSCAHDGLPLDNENDVNSSSTYERCSFNREYFSFPSLDELDEQQYKEPSRFMLESQTVLC